MLFAKSYYHVVVLHCIPFRYLTYSFLWAYNGWLLINPSTLRYDWQGGSIPLVESLCDHRNLATVMATALVFFLGYVSYVKLKVTTDIQITKHNCLIDCLICIEVELFPKSGTFVLEDLAMKISIAIFPPPFSQEEHNFVSKW